MTDNAFYYYAYPMLIIITSIIMNISMNI